MKQNSEMLREAYDALHASAQTKMEVLSMNETNNKKPFSGRRALVAALAVVLALALAVGAMAAAGVFNMRVREADPEETFAGPLEPEMGMPIRWDGAKLVFTFDGPAECQKIHFKPGYMPYDIAPGLSWEEDGGWYGRITCEGTDGCVSGQPCLIEARYAPMFVDGGSLLLLYADDTSDIVEEEWNGHRILKFGSHRANPNFPGGEHDVDACYYIMYQPEQGYILTLSSFEGNLDTLEQIAKSLEIEPTAETVSSADWHEHNEFMDCGIG